MASSMGYFHPAVSVQWLTGRASHGTHQCYRRPLVRSAPGLPGDGTRSGKRVASAGLNRGGEFWSV
jgi:hypothetical protein